MYGLINRINRNRIVIPFTPFFKHYPYRSPVSITSANARGCVDTDLEFFCNRIPKSANSSIVINLALIKTGDTIPSKQAKKIFKTPSQLSHEEVNSLRNYFRFVIVRNPYTRILSAYLDKIERKARMKNKDSSFEEFLRFLKNGGLYSNAHWAPQTSLLLMPLEEFDHVGKVETLQQDMPYILNKISGRSEDTQFASILSNSTNANEKVSRYYTRSLADTVKELYRQDFETFDYDLNLW